MRTRTRVGSYPPHVASSRQQCHYRPLAHMRVGSVLSSRTTVRIRTQVSNIMTVVPLVNAMYSPSHCMHGHASGHMAYATCSRFERDAPCPSCTYARCAMRCEAPGGVRMPGSMLSMDRCDALRASRRACSLPSR